MNTPQRPLTVSRRPATLRLTWNRATSAHVSSLYPFQTGPALGPNGIYLGHDISSGGAPWHYDPFQLYTDGTISSPNALILGMVGSGKSTAVKTLVHRSVGLLGSGNGQPRWCAILDPKGEYGPLASALGLAVLRLQPDGRLRLNPLDVTHGRRGVVAQRVATVSALAAAVLRRELRPVEEAALGWVLTGLGAERQNPSTSEGATLNELVARLANPDASTLTRAGMDAAGFADAVAELRYGLDKFIDGQLAGMFDGATTPGLDFDGSGVVIDLSAVHTDPDALAAVMIAATGWLQHLLMRNDGIRRIQVWEEIWALLGNETTARWFQSCQKLSRDYGVANIAVAHRISDLRAQADDGTAAAKVGAGLLADTQTRVLFRQSADQVSEAVELLGLTEVEAALLPRLVTGRALWHVGRRRGLVQHHVAPGEWPITRTDGALVV